MESPASMVMKTMPLGYRFHPTDEELVEHYLKHKLLGNDSMIRNIIAEVDICNHEPWDLPARSEVKSDDPEWFFLSPLGLKFTKSTRCNRRTEAGYWKVTGKDRQIKTRGTDEVIGTKKSLVFYKTCGRDRVGTNWVIHEYHALTFPGDDNRRFVLCRLMEKPLRHCYMMRGELTSHERNPGGVTEALMHDEGEPSSHEKNTGGVTEALMHDKGEPTSHEKNPAEALKRDEGKPTSHEKKPGGVIEALMHDEGKPSSHVAAKCENQATANGTPNVPDSPQLNLELIFQASPPEEEYCLPMPVLPQPPMDTDQEPCFGNRNSIMELPHGTCEGADGADFSFLDSIFLDEDVFICEGTSQTP